MRTSNLSFGILRSALHWTAGLLTLPLLVVLSTIARFSRKTHDVGFGPQPLINNVYHKRVMERLGYEAETFVLGTYYITREFDRNFEGWGKSRMFPASLSIVLASLRAFVHAIFSYRSLYIYFNGGPLGKFEGPLRLAEPVLLHLARVKVVVMPYGSDVQEMTRSPNLLFKHRQAASYPDLCRNRKRTAGNIDLWTRHADHVVSGVEWVDYMPYWDTLMLGHFSVDTGTLRPPAAAAPYVPGQGPLRLVHAPNHRLIKGTPDLLAAVEELQKEGFNIEIELIERRSNSEVIAAIERAHVVVDQLVVGWYAMFAIEAMALAKPVICYTRDDLVQFYCQARLLREGELPLLSADVLSIKSLLKDLALGKYELDAIGHKGRDYVMRHHSLEAVGRVFQDINTSIGLRPGRAMPPSAANTSSEPRK